MEWPRRLAAAATSRGTAHSLQPSWLASNAKQQDLLYVTTLDRTEVYVYTYPKGDFAGWLTGFGGTTGLCADETGDVFVSDAGGDIVEFAHGDARPIKTYADTKYGQAQDCTVDPTTGDLAVANYIDPIPGVGGGDVVVYHQKRPPYVIYDPNIGLLGYCSYDGHGNLFIDSLIQGFTTQLAELKKDSINFVRIPFPQQHGVGAALAWDGHHLTMAGPSNVVYRLRIDAAGAHIMGTTSLSAADGLAGYSIAKQTGPHAFDRLIGANYNGANVMIWQYPQGGLPITTIPDEGDTFSAVVSAAPHDREHDVH